MDYELVLTFVVWILAVLAFEQEVPEAEVRHLERRVERVSRHCNRDCLVRK